MLKPNKFKAFTANEIKPQGWLYNQLIIQAEGLCGNLDKVWKDVGESKWIGGNREGWERLPYWLDGFIPLAWLLDDEELKSRAADYINRILSNQKPDGWLCPCDDNERHNYDPWGIYLILKVLVVYHDCTDDPRIEPAVRKTLLNLKESMRTPPMYRWGTTRWYECLIAIYWLYERNPEEWLLDLALSLQIHGTNYRAQFENWRDIEPKEKWEFQTHVVNMAMALRSEILAERISNRNTANEFSKKMLETLQKYHGMACGHFTGDECLSGDSPIQGSELCGITEAMYSYETLFGATGDTYWLDRLEMTAFNALPAAFSDDMWTHQYDQMTNQAFCVTFGEKNIFRTNSPDAHIFGLEPNYGCCTANFAQGWPKFALSAFYKSENGIISAALIPSCLKTSINKTEVEIELKTEYPFKNKLLYTIKTKKSVSFDFQIRIPAWVKSASVSGQNVQAGTFHNVSRIWNGEETLEVVLDLTASFNKRPQDLYCLQYGGLIFSVPVEAEWVIREYELNGVERKFPYCDYELFPKSKWNYAFANMNFNIIENPVDKYPFSSKNPPVEITADLVEVDWGLEEGFKHLCARIPKSRTPINQLQKINLMPYGCAKLRMTEIPIISFK